MAVTIRQIAEAAGVSRGTVDRALNHRDGVKPDTAERINTIAKKMGYKPNLAAKILSGHQYDKRKIGIILVTEKNTFYDEVLQGVRAALDEFEEFGIGNTIRVMEHYDISMQLRIMDEMVQEGINGLVMTPIQCREISAKINELNEHGIKVVTINMDILDAARIAYVGCHHKKSGIVMAGLLGLVADGRPIRVGVVEGTEKNLAVARRTIGFFETLERDFPNVKIVARCENEDNDEQSFRVTEKLLQEHRDIDALCVLGAGIVGTIRAVQKMGLQETIKVFVYDLIDEVRQALYDGTICATITQEPYAQGYEGVQLLGKYLAYGQHPEQELCYTELSILTKYCLDK